jgi:S1-C subfamily serine protease
MRQPEPAPPAWQLWRGRLQTLGRRARPAAPFGAGVLAALAAVWLYNFFVPGPQPLTAAQVSETVAQALASATAPPARSAQVYAVIQPSLVLIQTRAAGAAGEAEGGLGTGVIIDDQGDILTSLHVVANAAEIQLTFADGSQSLARILVEVPENDIAVVQADQPPALPPAVLGNPNALQVGDEAYVVGNPFGLYSSISAGVVSGLNRSFEPPGTGLRLTGLIQVDAAVNPGNSGGPLLNRYGEVVGIVAGIVNPLEQDFFVGIGFAVPIDVAGGAAGLPPD